MKIEGLTWLLWLLIEGGMTIYLLFMLVFVSLMFPCSSGGNSTSSAAVIGVEYSDSGFDTGMTTFVAAAGFLCFIFAILFTINHFNYLIGYDRLILLALVVCVVYLAGGLVVFIPLIILQLRNRLPKLSAKECIHEWHIGVVVLASLSLVALIVTIILLILRILGKLPISCLSMVEEHEEDIENSEKKQESARRPSTAALSKVGTETDWEQQNSQSRPQLDYRSALRSSGLDVKKVESPRRLPPLRTLRRVTPEPNESQQMSAFDEPSPKKKKKKKKKKAMGEDGEYSQDMTEVSEKKVKKKKSKIRDEEDNDLNA